MDTILPAYNDPLFSILLIIVIALVISIVSYGWGIYKHQKEESNLIKFLEKFDTSECAMDMANMPFEPHMIKPLLLLAQAFSQSGEYQKAIGFYLYLIKNISQEEQKLDLMEKLGSIYFHAGFLERSKAIYEEVLRKKPRNPKVLHTLGVVYETMHNYTKAKEVLDPLSHLGEETRTLQTFLQYCELVSNKSLLTEQKVDNLIELLKKEPSLYREIIIALFRLDTLEAWKAIDQHRIVELIDLLWFLPPSQLNLDIISQNEQLSTLYYVKGYIEQVSKNSGIFTLDILANAKENGFMQGDLHFTYLCKKCKQSFPVSFKRCPSCMALHSIEVEEHIAKSNPKTDHSLL